MKEKEIEIVAPELPPPGAVPTEQLLAERLQALQEQARRIPPGAAVIRRGRDLVPAMAAAAAMAGWALARIYRSELGPDPARPGQMEFLEVRAGDLPVITPGARVIARVFGHPASGEVLQMGLREDRLRVLLREPDVPPHRAQVAWVEGEDVQEVLIPDFPPLPGALEAMLSFARERDFVVIRVDLPPPGAFARPQLAQAAWVLLGRHVQRAPALFFRRRLWIRGERVEAGVAQALAFTAARAGARGIRMEIPGVGTVDLDRPAGVGAWPGERIRIPDLGDVRVEAVGLGRRGLRALVRGRDRRSIWMDIE